MSGSLWAGDRGGGRGGRRARGRGQAGPGEGEGVQRLKHLTQTISAQTNWLKHRSYR